MLLFPGLWRVGGGSFFFVFKMEFVRDWDLRVGEGVEYLRWE